MTRPLVLVVDDDVTIRSLVRSTLDQRDLEIVEAADGASALELAHERTPQLVVLDWRMPGQTGFEVLTDLRRLLPSTRILVVSAEIRAAHGGLAEIFGADAFLEKPFLPQRLLEVVGQLLGDSDLDEMP